MGVPASNVLMILRSKVTMMRYALMLLLMSLARPGSGCFPIDEEFGASQHWLQITSLNSRREIEIQEDSGDILVVETEGLAKNRQLLLRCVMEYGENRYLVRIEDEDMNQMFGCYQFTRLAPHVIRQGRTEEFNNRKKVDCIDDPYTEDEEVLVAYEEIQPQQCPLFGGYQLILNSGLAVDGRCQESVKSYNPRIQFHCDGRGSGNVVVDFGRACVPTALAPLMGGRHLTHLRCVSTWKENGFSSLLLQMRDYPQRFWCLHYKVIAPGSSDLVGDEELVKAFLTVDGRCSSQAFSDEDVPRNTSMFGHLASYILDSDIRCNDDIYLKNCPSKDDKCLFSVDCPGTCKRCKKKTQTSYNCSFPSDTLGTWKVMNSLRQMDITVEKSKIKSSSFGEFLCMGPAETDMPGYTYPVVQDSPFASCMPYYACALVYSPTPGILTFQLQPNLRRDTSGEPMTCKDSDDLLGHTKPPVPEEVITLISLNKLQKTACNHQIRSTYPTLVPGCKVAIHECTGSCQTFNVTFEIPACANQTERPYFLESKHICYATINFTDGVHGILAKKATSGRFLCWLFGGTRLFVATPEDCNQESVTQIFQDASAHIHYDPLKAISIPLPNGNSAKSYLKQTTTPLFICLVLLACVLPTLFTKCVNR